MNVFIVLPYMIFMLPLYPVQNLYTRRGSNPVRDRISVVKANKRGTLKL